MLSILSMSPSAKISVLQYFLDLGLSLEAENDVS